VIVYVSSQPRPPEPKKLVAVNSVALENVPLIALDGLKLPANSAAFTGYFLA
jgi:hypothetical protein